MPEGQRHRFHCPAPAFKIAFMLSFMRKTLLLSQKEYSHSFLIETFLKKTTKQFPILPSQALSFVPKAVILEAISISADGKHPTAGEGRRIGHKDRVQPHCLRVRSACFQGGAHNTWFDLLR